MKFISKFMKFKVKYCYRKNFETQFSMEIDALRSIEYDVSCIGLCVCGQPSSKTISCT